MLCVSVPACRSDITFDRYFEYMAMATMPTHGFFSGIVGSALESTGAGTLTGREEVGGKEVAGTAPRGVLPETMLPNAASVLGDGKFMPPPMPEPDPNEPSEMAFGDNCIVLLMLFITLLPS